MVGRGGSPWTASPAPRFSGAGVTGAGRDAEVGAVGRLRRGADGRRLARSRGSRRAFERRRADTAGCVRRVGSGAPEFASLPAGACSFTGSSMSSTASAVASTIAAAAQTARGKRMPDRGRPPCVAVCGRFCPRTCFARRCAATADRVGAALGAVARFAKGSSVSDAASGDRKMLAGEGVALGSGLFADGTGIALLIKRSERRKWPPCEHIGFAVRACAARRFTVRARCATTGVDEASGCRRRVSDQLFGDGEAEAFDRAPR